MDAYYYEGRKKRKGKIKVSSLQPSPPLYTIPSFHRLSDSFRCLIDELKDGKEGRTKGTEKARNEEKKGIRQTN